MLEECHSAPVPTTSPDGSERPVVPDTVAIIGLGIIGCSLALALRKASGTTRVLGYDSSSAAASVAVMRGAVDAVCETAAAAAGSARLVVLAVPPSGIVEIGLACRPSLSRDTVITDVGGVKGRVSAAMELAYGGYYVGSHPMAGCERSGPEHASAELFCGAPWIVTPTASSSPDAVRKVRDLARLVGAVPHEMMPADHDRVVAILSHLPHALAYALAATAARALGASCDKLAGGSYRDATRVAGSPPALWCELMLDNRTEVLRSLGDFRSGLACIERALADADAAALAAALQAGAAAHRDPS